MVPNEILCQPSRYCPSGAERQHPSQPVALWPCSFVTLEEKKSCIFVFSEPPSPAGKSWRCIVPTAKKTETVPGCGGGGGAVEDNGGAQRASPLTVLCKPAVVPF